jgi:serine/threonine protein kinase/basic membrane lipoprotein Med (substrate-binding protein (PBP1-ABC) superfamily)
MDNLVGRDLGRYTILEPIGKGGMAVVYKARDTRLDRLVAIKVIRVDRFAPSLLDQVLKRFEREALALAKLSHPNIVHVHDYGDFEGAPYLVMEYLSGGNVRIKPGIPRPWQAAVRLVLPIAQALAYAHHNKIIHRDIKPSNILLSADGRPMLTDFGIARMLESQPGTALTGTGAGIGTPEYMAPEQWTGQAGPQSDQYSLAVVLYELVTGVKPYTADTPAGILVKQISEPLPSPVQFVPGLPGPLEQALLKALARQPGDRYPSMLAFARALQELLSQAATEESETVLELSSEGPFQASQPAVEPVPDQAVAPAGSGQELMADPLQGPAASRPHPGRLPKRLWAYGLLVLGVVAVAILGAGLIGGFPTGHPAIPVPTHTGTPLPGLVVPSLAPSLAPSSVPPSPTIPASALKVGIVLAPGPGGIEDKNYNGPCTKALSDASTQLGIIGLSLQPGQPSDIAGNIQQFLGGKPDLIITLGLPAGIATATAARANPDQKFVIVDYSFPDCWAGAVEGQDCGSSIALPNVLGLTFQTDQAAALAGYLAAGMSRTGKVATFGGIQVPGITSVMKGFQAGILQYNLKHARNVQLIGWDNATQQGVFIGNFDSRPDGKDAAERLYFQGADIILPLAGEAGVGAAIYCSDSRNCLVIGFDSDWFFSYPEYGIVELTSVQKRIDLAVFERVQFLTHGSFKGGTVFYDLANGGVDLAPYHNFENQVPQSLQDELSMLKASFINGGITVDSIYQDR